MYSISFNRLLAWTAFIGILIIASYFLVACLLNSVSKNQARSVCGYSIYEIDLRCIQGIFIGSPMKSKFLEYLDDADFVAAGSLQVQGVHYEIFHKSEYYEKGPREMLLIVGVNSGQIETIVEEKWVTANWAPGGGPESPFRDCVSDPESCKEFISG